MEERPAAGLSGYRWVVFVLLAGGYLLVYFHRLCPAVVALDMMHDLEAGGGMMGLLASHRMMPEDKYLERAQQMAVHLVDAQHPDGYWAFDFDRPVELVGISEKGTTLWGLLFYRLYSQTGDEQYLVVARKALRWGMDAQYAGDDLNAAGGIVGRSPASGVVYRRWFPLICTYTMAWHGLAILEEIKLDVTAG